MHLIRLSQLFIMLHGMSGEEPQEIVKVGACVTLKTVGFAMMENQCNILVRLVI